MSDKWMVNRRDFSAIRVKDYMSTRGPLEPNHLHEEFDTQDDAEGCAFEMLETEIKRLQKRLTKLQTLRVIKLTQPNFTYLDPNEGEIKRERRRFVRGQSLEQVEQLFNGFHNLIENLRGKDGYLTGYAKAMLVSFAEIAQQHKL